MPLATVLNNPSCPNYATNDSTESEPTLLDTDLPSGQSGKTSSSRKSPVYKCPCGICLKPAKCNQKRIQCCDIDCKAWFHIKCINMPDHVYQRSHIEHNIPWLCNRCAVPFMFNDSFFSDSSQPEHDVQEDQQDSGAQEPPIFEEIIHLRRQHPGNLVVSYININSVQNKFEELRLILDRGLIDCLFVAETKLNDSHTTARFQVANYHLYRKDNKHDNGGGLLCYIRSDIPSREEKFDTHPCENLTVIAQLNDKKCALIGTYRKPSLPESVINDKLDPLIDRCTGIADHVIVAGDLNCNMLRNGRNGVRTLCDNLNLVNVVTEPTCFKGQTPTLLDVILTTDENCIKKCYVLPCVLSDFHHFVCAVLNFRVCKIGNRQILYRSFYAF